MKKLILAAFSMIILGMVNVNAQTLNESFEGTFPPNDWTFYNYSNLTSQWSQNTFSPIAGTLVVRLTGSSWQDHDDWMIPPKLSITSTTDSIHFFARKNGAAAPTHSIDVKVSTTGKDTASFTTLLGTVSPDAWTRHSFDLSAYNGQDIYIALHSTSSGSTNMYIDSVTGPTLFVPSCQTVAYVNATNVTHNSVELTWDSIANAESYTYEIFEDGEGPAGTVVVSGSTTDTNIVVNGLPFATDLEVWITTDCGTVDGLSEIDGPFTFSTICGPITDPHLEEFEQVAPTCWTEARGELALNTVFTSTFSNWQNGTFSNQGLDDAARVASSTFSNDEWLITPTIHIDSIPNSQISFFASLTSTWSTAPTPTGNFNDPDDELKVVVSTDDGVTWSDTNVVYTFDTSNAPSHTGSYITIPMGDYTGDIKVGFYSDLQAGWPNFASEHFFIDKFKWSETPTCDIIAQISLDSVDTYNGYISWDTSTAATDFIVEYGTPGFTLGTGTQFTVSGDLFTTISGLDPITEYEVYVAPICSPTDTGDFQLSLTFTTECAPLVAYFIEDFTSFLPNDCWSEANGFLQDTTILTSTWSDWGEDGFLNVGTTGAARNTVSSWSSFTNEWLITESIDLDSMPYAQIEFDAGITTSFGTTAADMQPDDRIVILVSTDNGDTWLEANTLYTFTDNNQPPHTGEHYEIPVTTYSGVVKFAFYVESTATGGSSYNFYVDNFQVSEAPTCLPTIDYTVISVEDTTATISWGNINGVNDYIVEYGEAGFTPGTGAGTQITVTTGTSVELTGLEPVTEYDFYVKAICSPTDTAEFLLYDSFETECLILSTSVLEEFTTIVAPECWYEGEGELTNSTVLTGSTSSWMPDGWLNVGSTGSARIRVFGDDEYHWLVSPSINLGTQEKQIEFDAGQTTTNGTSSAAFASDDRLAVVISLDNGLTWSEDNILLEFNQSQPLLNAGGHYTASLADFAGSGQVRIGFYSESEITNLQMNAYIDNFELKDLDTTAVDLGVIDIEVADTFCVGDAMPLSAIVENSGFVPVPTYPLRVKIYDATTIPYNTLLSFFTNIQVDETDTTFITNLDFLQPGDYAVDITVLANGDVNAMNNKYTANFHVSDYPEVFAGSDITICEGESYVLEASGANSYSWTGGFNNLDTVTPTTTTSYIVAGANEAGCETLDTVVVNVEVNAPPTILYINQLLLTDPNGPGNGLYLNYYWQFNGNTVGTNSTYAPTQNGMYTLVVETFSGCEVLNTIVVAGIGLPENTDHGVSVYPNPVKDQLHVETDKVIEDVRVFDLNARQVIDGGFTGNGLDVSKLEEGIYILYGTADGQPFQKKFTKQ